MEKNCSECISEKKSIDIIWLQIPLTCGVIFICLFVCLKFLHIPFGITVCKYYVYYFYF